MRHVAFEGFDIFADVLDRRIKFRLAASGDEDIGPFRDKTPRGREPDSAAAAGDQGDLAIESLASNLPIWRPPLLDGWFTGH